MKRAIIFAGIMMFTATNIFAATVTAVNLNTTAGSVPGFTRSKNVDVAYASETATGGGALYFSISAKNSSGNKIYAAISTQSAVYAADDPAGILTTGDNPTCPTADGAAITGGKGGWTSM